jgi:hypothetical protein
MSLDSGSGIAANSLNQVGHAHRLQIGGQIFGGHAVTERAQRIATAPPRDLVFAEHQEIEPRPM